MQVGFTTLREVGAELSDIDVELALHAVALSNWHRAHPCCAKCGAPTRLDLGGAVRVCDVDKSQHHPRTDGAVIVLIRDKDDRILLGHQPVWPEGRFSCFAGFLEPGETTKSLIPDSINLRIVWRAKSVALLTLPPFTKSRFPNSFNPILPPKSTVGRC